MIAFNPYQGPAYYASNTRLLVVGHSHWGAVPSPSLTIDTVNEWMLGEQNLPYFSKLARVLTGADAVEVDRKKAFSNISFYNFYQSVLRKHDAQPTDEQFQVATKAFPEILKLLNPTHILVTGITLWNDMPGFDSGDGQRLVSVDRYNTYTGRYNTPGGYAIAVGIVHMASYGFSPPKWNKIVQDFLTWR